MTPARPAELTREQIDNLMRAADSAEDGGEDVRISPDGVRLIAQAASTLLTDRDALKLKVEELLEKVSDKTGFIYDLEKRYADLTKERDALIEQGRKVYQIVGGYNLPLDKAVEAKVSSIRADRDALQKGKRIADALMLEGSQKIEELRGERDALKEKATKVERIGGNAISQVSYMVDEIKKAFEQAGDWSPSDIVDSCRQAATMLKERDGLRTTIADLTRQLADDKIILDEERTINADNRRQIRGLQAGLAVSEQALKVLTDAAYQHVMANNLTEASQTIKGLNTVLLEQRLALDATKEG